MRPFRLLVTLLAIACSPHQPPSGAKSVAPAAQSLPSRVSQPASGPSGASVTVAMVIDQLAAWVARDRLHLLPKDGGFARLRREGTWYQDVRFAHAITETAPGHASLFTGKTPRENGIVANELWKGDHSEGIVADDTARIVGVDGPRPEFSASLSALVGEVVADRFKAKLPQSRVYSVSLKDRGALFGGGHHPDLSLWYDAKLGQFITSTAFAAKLPAWIVPAIGQAAVKTRLEEIWMPLHDYSGNEIPPGTSDAQAGESNFAMYGVTFPHQPSHSTQPMAAFRAHPASDRMLLELALLAIDNTPPNTPTLLSISLSANDYIGHLFGPDSWEAKDELFRLDASLAWFFQQLDKRRGAEGWGVVLSADHGIVPLPEVSRFEAKTFHEAGTHGTRPTELTERLLSVNVTEAAKKAASLALGKGNWVAAFVDPYIYLSPEAKQLPAERATKLKVSLVQGLRALPCVSEVFVQSELPNACPAVEDESLPALVCRSVQPGRGGEFYVALKPGCFFDTGYDSGFGTSHGNAGLADRSIPLLTRAPGKVAAGKVEPQPHSFELYSRELTRLLGIE